MASHLGTPFDMDTLGNDYIGNTTMTRMRRKIRQRQRSVNECFRLQRRKSVRAQDEWQASQIQIWHRMNDEALLNEKRLRNVSQPIDKPEVKLI